MRTAEPGMETSIDGLLARMDALLAPMIASNDERRHFLSVYMRTTAAVRDELARPSLGGFVDPAWAERWDLAFAELYLEALERWNEDGTAPGPWQVAFALAASEPRIPPLRHLLLGMNAHVNFDLPQALLAVITDQQNEVQMIEDQVFPLCCKDRHADLRWFRGVFRSLIRSSAGRKWRVKRSARDVKTP